MSRPTKIGTALGKPIKLQKDARDVHMHLLGVSRQGKSYFMEHMARQDILDGHGVCIIDPHGPLYDNMVDWLARHEFDQTRTIHLLNPSDDEWTFGFNPLIGGVEGGEVTTRIDWMVEAMVRVWGGTDMTQTPLLAKCLRSVFYALAQHKLSLAEAQIFTTWDNKETREALTLDLNNAAYQKVWDELNTGVTAKMFYETFGSTNSRLLEFLGSPRVLDIVGQTKNTIDFRKCMDDGDIVLVNLSTGDERISANNSRVLGATLFNNLFRSAFGRDKKTAQERPFYCYVDECARFLTADIAMSLDETAKFGLHLLLSHQRLSQLGKKDDDIYDAVMTGAQTKVVFNVGSEDTADALSRHLFRNEFDLEKSKPSMEKPVTIGHETVWLESVSTSEGTIRVESTGGGSSSGVSAAVAQSFSDAGSEFGGFTETSGGSDSSSESWSSSSGSTSTTTHGVSQSLKPILQMMPGQLETLEEQIHRGIALLRGLPPRHAIAYSPTIDPVLFTTPDVLEPETLSHERTDFLLRVNQNSPYVTERKVVRAAIQKRDDDLALIPFQPPVAPDTDDDGRSY